MTKARLLRVVPAAVFGAGLVVALAGPVSANEDPPGNNGTVKIDGVEFDQHPDNEPHVGCEFQVDFYGYDEGDLEASVLFELIPPTPADDSQELLFKDGIDIGGDPAGGGTDLDAEETFDLTQLLVDSGVEPHPTQGFHIKLTVNAEGSIGADVKHKVFWVEDCRPTPPTTAPPTTAPPTTAPGETTTTAPGVSPEAPPTTTPGGELPRTGSNTAPMLVGALSLLALGTAGVYGSKHLRKARSS